MEGSSSLLLGIIKFQTPNPLSLLHSTTTAAATSRRRTRRTAPSSLVPRAELPEAGGQPDPSAVDGKKPKPSGFGSVADSSSKNKKSKRIIRRSPIEKPSLLQESGQPPSPAAAEQQSANESAFLITWLGLGIVIFVQGIALAASGFLPEKWDSFLVKYLYPSFTPTVFLFVCGTVVYGVIKYLQGEKMK
ncbi:protein LOW PSII ACCUMULATION 2, chloroplastic [Iris pallida]|uniref:Protein LOW PSII ACCUMULATION 2, chloroplastic n=1 Tax=Iris pallida TaxID=29817 RepID=A0AAX6HEJ6_IRIPA|nr:protein LOW PSII ACCUMULATION 2, chloroplastic [Iris pallida]